MGFLDAPFWEKISASPRPFCPDECRTCFINAGLASSTAKALVSCRKASLRN
jgi:hypothetical protein